MFALLQTDPAAPLMLPDSVQKADFAQTLLSKAMWGVINIMVALNHKAEIVAAESGGKVTSVSTTNSLQQSREKLIN